MEKVPVGKSTNMVLFPKEKVPYSTWYLFPLVLFPIHPIVNMNHMKLIFQDLPFYCTKKVTKKHYQFCHFCHEGGTHLLVLALTLIEWKGTIWHLFQEHKPQEFRFRCYQHHRGLQTTTICTITDGCLTVNDCQTAVLKEQFSSSPGSSSQLVEAYRGGDSWQNAVTVPGRLSFLSQLLYVIMALTLSKSLVGNTDCHCFSRSSLL